MAKYFARMWAWCENAKGDMILNRATRLTLIISDNYSPLLETMTAIKLLAPAKHLKIMTKDKLIKRLNWYYPTERFNAFMFSGITISVIIRFGLPETLFLIYGLFLMTFILFQGQHYWKLKLYSLTNKHFQQQKNIVLFKRMRGLNQILIGLFPGVLCIQLFIFNWTIMPENLFVWSIIANGFAVLEHVNYYNRQLMIDNLSDVQYIFRNRKLKIASLKKDLDENQL